ncbi:MAG TPA: ABC transporter permease [Flavisolibacter sp.]|jgi:putative ABC transport system permease protein
MFRNYFKIAIRNLLRYKGFSFINILSLSIGIFGCLVIGLFVWDEQQYDKDIPGAENIYRIYNERKDNNGTTYAAPVQPAYTTFIQQQYPEVENVARILMSGDKYLFEVGEKAAYEEKGIFVDPSFFKMFSIRFVKGDPATALTTPQSIILSEDLASKYFGNNDPIGKTVSIDKDTFEVKGVMGALPKHFHLDFKYLMPIAALNFPQARIESWGWHQFYSYVKLKPGASVTALQDKFQAYIKKEILPKESGAGAVHMPFFQPLTDIHLKSSAFVYDNAVRGNESYVKGLTIIALFVLVIACFNFINLATARSFRRAKEIGVRKVVGAGRSQLIIQFIGETVLLSLISMVIAVLGTLLVIPSMNEFTGKSIEFNPVTNPLLGLAILVAGIVLGVLAGIYPALFLSGFRPIKVLKNMKLTGGSGSWLRPALVVVQFALSVLLIVATLIVYRQTEYLNDKDLGFDKEQVIYFEARGDVAAKVETFKSELKKSPNIVSVTSGYGLPGDAFAGETIRISTKEGEKEAHVSLFLGDHDYVKTLGLDIISGRDFSRSMSTDVREAFIINETAVKEFGYGTPEKALGQTISWDEWEPQDTNNPIKKGKVVGVIKDFHFKSLHEKVTPCVIHIYPQVLYKVAAKLKTSNMQGTIAHINNVWEQFSPGYPLDYKFMDETYGQMYATERKLSSLLWIFAIMAIVVGCMGLFGLAAFSAEQRTKEIGIRKVLGASIFNIVGLLSKNFLLMVLLSSIIAFPVAYWAMNSWLEDFPYRVNISWWIFVIAVIAALLIAFITVSFQSIKAATVNPVKSLRTE